MRKFLGRLSPLFVVIVVMPTLAATLYFGAFASDVYVSEARFVVRSPSKAAATSLGQVLNGTGLSGVTEESNAVVEYLESRAALEDADHHGLLTRAYSAASVSKFDRFGGFLPVNRERFFSYYLGKVEVEPDTTTQVLHLRVSAFEPAQARAINERLLERSEALVNRLSSRARRDALATAEEDARAAQTRARDAAVRLAAYRNRAGIIDPKKEAEARLQGISKLEDELLSARYQVLLLDSELAAKHLAATLISWQDAHAEARRKRAYVERIAAPSMPD